MLTKRNILSAVAVIMVVLTVACSGGQDQLNAQSERDSLLLENEQLNSTIHFITSTLDSISVHEQLLFVSNNDGQEVVTDRQVVEQRLLALAQLVSNQREQLTQLQGQLDKSTGDNHELKRLLAIVNQQLAQKDEEIKNLQEELADSRKSIDELRGHVQTLSVSNTRLQQDVKELSEQTASQEEALAAQDKLINQGFVKVGTSAELRELGLLRKGGLFTRGKVQLENLRQESFQVVDIREFTQLGVKGKKVKLLTPAPESSYTLQKSGDGYQLSILNPTAFWSVSNYLIIQVD